MTSADNTVYLFSHGLAANYKEIYKFTAYSSFFRETEPIRYIIQWPYYSFNYPDATERFWRINFWHTNLGQYKDIDTLATQYQKIVTHNPQANIVIVGISRGAATAFNFCALHHPEQVKALVLESPFDSIDHIIESHLERHNLPISKKWAKKLLSLIFRKYRSIGIEPIKLIKKFPLNLPILIICTKQDRVVPCESSVNLYNKLIENGHKNAELLLLEAGRHGFLFLGPQADLYTQTTNNFYKKYHLITAG